MRFKGLLLFSFLLTIAVAPAFAQYTGGDNDGDSVGAICVNTLDGVDQFSFGTMTGSTTFCDFSSESYSVSLNNGPQDVLYLWSVPPGSSVIAGDFTANVTVQFGNTPGTVSVTVITACASQTFNLGVTNGSCSMYQGDIDDGFSVGPSCSTTLDGGAMYSVIGIVGSSTFCEFGTEGYSLSSVNAPANTYYNWTVPADATIVTGQGTANITVLFGNTAGSVGVTVVTDCNSITPAALNVTPTVCSFYAGGDNDGFSDVLNCASKLDGSPALVVSAIAGSAMFCDFATESYSVNIQGMNPETFIVWSVPAGATIVSGQGTSTILVAFSNTSGNISVDVTNLCYTVSNTLPVSNTSCIFYAGGDNDGFSTTQDCASTLNGAPTLTAAVTGSSTFCDFSTDVYSVNIQGSTPETTIVWSVPPGATILSGQGTASIFVAFGNSSGNVSVLVSNQCYSVSNALPVTNTSCIFYSGGDNDGATVTQACVSDLNGGDAFIPGPIVGNSTTCELSSQIYSISVQNAPASTTYVWSVPAGATIISGQGTSTVFVAFGNTSGDLQVVVGTECGTTKTVILPITLTNCIYYSGGNNDGFSDTSTCLTALDGTSAFIPGPVVGSTTSCEFATESYTITVANGLSTTAYSWSVPAGATIISGQGTNTVLVAFGNTSGNVSVDVSNECTTINVSLPVTVSNCIFYAGGNNDGFSSTPICIGDLNGGTGFVPGPVVGSAASCEFSTESYTIFVVGASLSTGYVWTAPAGSTIISGQGTNSVLIAFGNTSGNVAVAVSNECTTINVSLPVAVSNCIFYAGGNNDGFSDTQICMSNLNGGSAFVPGAIAGPASFCNFSSEAYSISVTGATSATTYFWTVPAGASIVSGQGTTSILVSFGNTSGNIAVSVSNSCTTIPVTLAVSGSSCIFYAGGNNDGFSVTTISNFSLPLPVSLVSFDATVKDDVVYLTWETASEFENDFFLIERSHDGVTFEALTKVEGAGTTKTPQKYQARDDHPYHGTSYYRLSQTDYDGEVAFNKVLIVKIETFAEISKLYPNPVKKDDVLHVDYFAEEDGQVKISVINPAGISSDSQMIDVKAGVNLFEFAPHFQAAGVHVIIIRSKEKATALRLVVL